MVSQIGKSFALSHSPGSDKLTLHLEGDKVKAFIETLNRALNTWDDAPTWLHEMSDYCNGVPSPYNARSNVEHVKF